MEEEEKHFQEDPEKKFYHLRRKQQADQGEKRKVGDIDHLEPTTGEKLYETKTVTQFFQIK